MSERALRRATGVVVVAASAAGAVSDDAARKTRELVFRPDRVYEVTGIWVKQGRLGDLNAYFGKVFPIAAADYGVRPLFGLEPLRAHAGDFLPDVMFVNEWPSLDHFRRFVGDERALALFPERDAAVSRLVVTQYSVPAEVRARLSEGDVVEFGAMWVKPGAEGALKSYYARAVAIAERHGLRPLTPLSPVFAYSGGFRPDRAALNLWGELERFDAFAAEAKPLFPERDASLERLEVTHARVRFEGSER